MKSSNHSNLNILPELIQGKRVIIISDDHVWPLVKEFIEQIIQPLPYVICIPPGEQSKNLDQVSRLATAMIEQGFDRDAFILAIGGGVVTDLAGFLASIYQRGIAYINIPTTLLAQVDAAIGGKTAVNLEIGKNQLGTFYPPVAVINDPRFLRTLPSRELRAGLAEVVKIAMIADANFWDWLEENTAVLLEKDQNALQICVQKACELKQKIVTADFHDRGNRMLLNFGHTAGHVLETLSEYQHLLHGEAVALGMLIELQYAERVGLIHSDLNTELALLLSKLGLNNPGPININFNQIQKYLSADKKRDQRGVRFAIPTQIGQGEIFYIENEKDFIESFLMFSNLGL